MNNEELKKVCDTYKEYISDDLDRGLMMLAKEIERETRHKCVSLAYDLANNINNLNKV